LMWMKLSEIARYWAARELTRIERPRPDQVALQAPFACPQLTLKLALAEETGSSPIGRVRLVAEGKETVLLPVQDLRRLKAGTFHQQNLSVVACVDLPKGAARLELK